MTSKDELTANAGWVQRAKAGDKVVCINDKPMMPDTIWYEEPHPVEGTAYTISEVEVLVSDLPHEHGQVSFFFNEIDPNWSFLASRFKPAIAAKTEQEDVNMIRSLLSIGNEELAADKQRVDYLLDALELAWAAHGVEE